MRGLAAFGALLALAILLQWLGGAYSSEFGGHPDEPAHYVTGLMVHDYVYRVRDYIAGGSAPHPLAFARDYYDHYPKVALGNWPPVFYLIQSSWTLLFSPARGSVIALMGVLTALLAWLLYRALATEFGPGTALAASVLFIALPLVQIHTALLMTEIPISLFAFLAMLSFARFLDQAQTRDGMLFGLFAALGILTKGSAVSLALAAPIAVVLSRRFDLLTRFAFWIPVPIVVVLAGPWTWRFRDEAQAGWLADQPNWAFTSEAFVYYPRSLVLSVGVPLFALAVIGLAAKLRMKNRKPASGLWSSAAGLLFAVLFFHLIIPAGHEARHLIPALPALLMFVAAGVEELAAVVARQRPPLHRATALAWAVAAVAFLGGTFRVYHKTTSGFGALADGLLADSDSKRARFIISSDATGEGVFIAEIAMREKRPGHTIRRASKVLASSRWSGADYRAKFDRAEDLIAALEKQRITLIVVDESIPPARRMRHHDLLRAALDAHATKFELEGEYPYTRDGVRREEALRVYRPPVVADDRHLRLLQGRLSKPP